MKSLLVLTTLSCLLSVRTIGAICTFPVDLLGVWISTYNGPMVFDTSEILGYTTNIPNAPKMELNCLERNDNFYILKSSHVFHVFGQEVHLYLCLEIEQQSNSIFQYSIRTEYNRYLKEYMYGHVPGNNFSDICVDSFSKPFLLVRNVSLTDHSIGYACPDIIHGYYGYMSKFGSTDNTCNEGVVESCKMSTQFQLHIDNECFKMFGNTTFTCIYSTVRSSNHYLYTWTDDEGINSLSLYGFFCMEISKKDSSMEISIFADACSNDTSNGPLLKIKLSDLSSQCYDGVESTTHTTVSTIDSPPADPALIAVIVLIACISLTLPIIFLLHWHRHILGLKCTLRQQTTDTKFHDIS